MADATCTLETLGDAIVALCGEYAEEVERRVREDVDAAAKVTLDAVAGSSPRLTGRYAAGWTAADDGDALRGYSVVIHNKSKPGLTHLLEKGHGGPQPAPAHPHIAQAAEAGFAELERRMSSG